MTCHTPVKKYRKALASIYIGTSGWSYDHWKDNFYPQKLKNAQWLNFYSENFLTVEINSTFYRMPRESTVDNWFKQVPENFLFSVKASQYITHRKRLHDCQDSVEYFYKMISHLESKMGPILFQLPPSFKINAERLNEFIGLLDKKSKITFEFRHPSWFCDEIYEILNKNNIALCITDLNGQLSPEEITGDFTYIRLHGPQKAYQGSYNTAEIKNWKKKIEKWTSKNISVFCYFDNDEKGHAIADAKSLQTFFKSK